MKRLLALCLLGCAAEGPPPAAAVESAAEVGPVGQSALILGRDGGWAARVFGREVFVFGDTFVTAPDADGETFHANSLSFTDDEQAGDGIAGLEDPLDARGSPRPLVLPTADEAAFNAAHRGDDCREPPCGARWAVWPGATVMDLARGRAFVSYGLIYAEPGPFNFHGVGGSLAVWTDAGAPAGRPEPGACPDHPTLLFCEDEQDWTGSLVVDGDFLYGFSCVNDGFESDCRLARAPLADPLDRGAWRGWDGAAFGPLGGATKLFTGGLNMRVARNARAGGWLAVYSKPFSNDVTYRTAPSLTGPWSAPATLFTAHQPGDGTTYDAYIQPDYDEDGGRVVYVTFSRATTGWFGSELVLERVTLK